jgi:hypothetical protein
VGIIVIMTPPKHNSGPKMSASSDDAPLLTVAGIRALHAEFRAKTRLLAELPGEIAAIKERLDAALLFAPKGLSLSVDAEESPVDTHVVPEAGVITVSKQARKRRNVRIIRTRNGRLTWTGAVMGCLAHADGGLSHRELKAKIAKTELASRFKTSDKGFYGAIAKLADSGKLVKFGGLLYARKVAEKLQKNGKSLPDKTAESRRRGAGTFVVEVLREFPTGLSTAQIKQLVSAKPEAPKSIREHGQYIYSILAPLIKSGEVQKQDGIYRLAEIGEANGAGNTVGLEAHASATAR